MLEEEDRTPPTETSKWTVQPSLLYLPLSVDACCWRCDACAIAGCSGVEQLIRRRGATRFTSSFLTVELLAPSWRVVCDQFARISTAWSFAEVSRSFVEICSMNFVPVGEKKLFFIFGPFLPSPLCSLTLDIRLICREHAAAVVQCIQVSSVRLWCAE